MWLWLLLLLNYNDTWLQDVKKNNVQTETDVVAVAGETCIVAGVLVGRMKFFLRIRHATSKCCLQAC